MCDGYYNPHSAERIYDTTTFTYKFGLFIEVFVRSAVPLFWMISGSLIFDNHHYLSTRVLKRFLSIFLPIVYFSCIYYLVDLVRGRANYPFLNIFRGAIGYIPLNPAFHLWYLFSMIGLYTISPLIQLKLPDTDRQKIGLLYILSLIFLVTNAIKVLPFGMGNAYLLDGTFLYMIIGHIIFSIKPNYRIKFSLFLYIITCLIIFILQYRLVVSQGAAFWNNYGKYESLGIFISAVLLFHIFHNINYSNILKNKIGLKIHNIVEIVSKYSLKIYGYHLLILFVLKKCLEAYNFRAFIQLFLMFILTPAISLLISIFDTWLWKKFRQLCQPLAERFLGLVKSIKMGYNISK